jgi:DNA-binding IclR family transcriptional regulator
LACLIRERLVEQRLSDKRYQLGPLLGELALSAPARGAPPEICRERLASVGKRFGGLVFLMIRSGNEYVCAMRAGHAELRAVSVETGTRRPLITSAGGVSILLALPEHEAQRIRVNNIRQEISRAGDARLKNLDQMYRRSQAFGYGVNLGDVVPGIHAVGVPVFSRPGKPVASLCLMTWSDSLPESRVDEACEALMIEAPAAAACCASEPAG